MSIRPGSLTVRTREVPATDPRHDRPLLDLLPDQAAVSWVRGGEGLVGWGVAARLDTSGPRRFEEADTWWRRCCEQLTVDDDVRVPGSGAVAFASLAFAAEPGRSVLILPRVIVGQRAGVRWVTTVGEHGMTFPEPTRVRRPGQVRYSDGLLSASGYRKVVAEAVRRMRQADGPRKIVLSHDLLASTSEPLDARFVLRNLAASYDSCWTFAVDGLIGATPELLLERIGNHVRSRVLAGTMWPRDGLAGDQLAAELLASSKNRREHGYAVDSLAVKLRPFCHELDVPAQPRVLRLSNVMHLESEVEGVLDEHHRNTGLLRMTDAVHPTAAVGGTPSDEAVRAIEELEQMDRERYAGPVGWIDAAGNGELAPALRCAQVTSHAEEGSQVRLFAGCGIVPDSEPDLEVAEAEAKFLPIKEALRGTR
jgi:menaquinone-specific isochorismate synthase